MHLGTCPIEIHPSGYKDICKNKTVDCYKCLFLKRMETMSGDRVLNTQNKLLYPYNSKVHIIVVV